MLYLCLWDLPLSLCAAFFKQLNQVKAAAALYWPSQFARVHFWGDVCKHGWQLNNFSPAKVSAVQGVLPSRLFDSEALKVCAIVDLVFEVLSVFHDVGNLCL